jgi:hypothetical protein
VARLGEIAGAIRERHIHLAALPPPLRHRLFHHRDANLVAFGDEQLVQPRRRQLLLAAGPAGRLGEHALDPLTYGVPDRTGPRLRLFPNRHRFGQVLAYGVAGDPELPRHLPL